MQKQNSDNNGFVLLENNALHTITYNYYILAHHYLLFPPATLWIPLMHRKGFQNNLASIEGKQRTYLINLEGCL